MKRGERGFGEGRGGSVRWRGGAGVVVARGGSFDALFRGESRDRRCGFRSLVKIQGSNKGQGERVLDTYIDGHAGLLGESE